MRLRAKEIRALLKAMELLGWGSAKVLAQSEHLGLISFQGELYELKRLSENKLCIRISPELELLIYEGVLMEPAGDPAEDLHWDLYALELLLRLSSPFQRPLEFNLLQKPISDAGDLLLGTASVHQYGAHGLLIGDPLRISIQFPLWEKFLLELRAPIAKGAHIEGAIEELLGWKEIQGKEEEK